MPVSPPPLESRVGLDAERPPLVGPDKPSAGPATAAELLLDDSSSAVVLELDGSSGSFVSSEFDEDDVDSEAEDELDSGEPALELDELDSETLERVLALDDACMLEELEELFDARVLDELELEVDAEDELELDELGLTSGPATPSPSSIVVWSFAPPSM